jgi:hypothetical protein
MQVITMLQSTTLQHGKRVVIITTTNVYGPDAIHAYGDIGDMLVKFMDASRAG